MANRKDSKGRMLKRGGYIRKSDGRYVYSYTDPLGRRKFIYANDIAELREKEKGLMRDQLDGLDVYARGRATLNTTFDRYIATKCNLCDSTKNGYLYTYDRFVREGFGQKRIAEIKYSDVLQFYLYLLKEKDIAISTLDSVHCVIHPAFQLAVRDEIIRINPTDRVMANLKRKIGRQTGVKRALTIEQQRAFLGYLEDTNSRWKNMFTVKFGTGVRIGELIWLRWEDIDLEAGRIEINHSITYYPRRQDTYKCEFRASLPKAKAGIRTIPMLPEVKEAFIKEKELQDMLGISCESEVEGLNGFIFCNRFNQLHNPQGVNRLIKRIREDYNAAKEVKAAKERREPIIIPPFSNHIARHTF